MNTPTLTLRALDLFANWGFADGEILLHDVAYQKAVAGVPVEPDHHMVLCALVDRYLLPALPKPLKVIRLEYTNHNPIRINDEEYGPEALDEARSAVEACEVHLTEHQIWEVLRDQLHAQTGAWLDGPVAPMANQPGTSSDVHPTTIRKKTSSRATGRRATKTPPPPATPSSSPPRQASLPFPLELIIDNFAGGGGTSEGLEQAFGRPVDIAINHDPEALAMHAMNHPHTMHLCESVWDINPIEVTKNQPVALVWLSPDCKHFSKAKGSTPVSKNIRGLAWVGMRWIATTKPRVLMLENVEEFQNWGPLMTVIRDGEEVWMPDPKKRGVTFQSFVRQIREHGYKVEWRELRACDNGAPTIRKRLFLIARRDGQPIVWPEQTHAEPTNRAVIAGNLLPHRTAAECIDFSLPSQSVFGRKRDLALNTQRRVAKGLWRHVLNNATPFIVNTRNGERPGQDPRIRSLDEPYWTVTGLGSQGALSQPVLTPFMAGAGGPEYAGKPGAANQPCGTLTTENHRALVAPELAPLGVPFLTEHANSSNQRTMSADEPLRTICAQVKGGHFSVVEPKMAPLIMTNTSGQSGATVEDLQPTVTSRNHHALVAPVIAPLRGTEETHLAGDSVEEPLSTISAGGTHHAMVAAHLVDMGHGESSASGARRWSHGVRSVEVPLNTVTASGATSALAAVHLTKFRTGSSGASVEEPMPTVTANSYIKRPGGAAPLGMVAVHLTHLTHHGERSGYSPGEPFKTITGANRGEQAVVAACLEQAYGGFSEGNPGRPVDAPISTIMSKGANQRLITAYMVRFDCNDGQWLGLKDSARPLPTKGPVGHVERVAVPVDCLDEAHREKAKFCALLLHEHLPEEFPDPAEMVLVFQQGQWWVLVDITLRMLKPRELFNAQGFPRTYVINEIPDPAKLFVNGIQVANPLEVPRIPLTATAQVRMCGNSVSPYQSKALAIANFRHEALINMQAAA